ncbi:MAG: calcium-transporting P-type ATPase, PMR1-type [Candidatus Aenigmarchaeota archaeon]|nr:calcium-transporting P-type ATPase, PMR1-type [Candidatus Aenigmarchaeota archaeon]
MEPYQLEAKDVFKLLGSSGKGLEDKEVAARIEKYGYNELAEAEKTPQLVLFLDQFKSVLIAVLLAATITSAVLGEVLDAIVIFSIVIMNAFLGFFQERKAERALEALKRISAPQATVIRNGKQKIVASREIVPGDMILLKVGDKVPADARIIEEMNLKCDESVLTGESEPVKKSANRIKREAPVAERTSIVFSGTSVVYGHCAAISTATAMNTEFGRIARLLQVSEEQSPLQQKMEVLGKQIGIMVLIISAIVFMAGMALGGNILQMFLTSVALAVAAIPEGLPAVVTITLAIGLQRMAKRNAIIRKLPAVETLGSTSIICSDKTGTLTANEMTVRKIFVSQKVIDVTGEGYSTDGKFLISGQETNADAGMLLKTGLYCNDAELESRIGDPTELALLVSAQKAGFEDERVKNKRVDEIPFESERKMMSVAYAIGNKRTAFTKGAVEAVLEKCSHIWRNGKIKRLTAGEKEFILEANHKFASSALRVLAFAFKELEAKEKLTEKNLVFAGLQAMIDPPRSEAKDAIAKCKQAGISVVMITGDHKDTAVAIAKELELIDGEERALTGEELDKLDEKAFLAVVEDVSVYARVSPEHKVRITGALKEKGHIVAMTGDGVNDAPALKKADIGIAMGITGTDVSKEASDMVLTDDNFSSIVSAVEEGRGVYDNIKKFVYYLLSANIGEVLIIFVAILIGLFSGSAVLPLVPVQLLWINLLTDGLPALALGVEPKEPDIMKRRPRNPGEKVLNRHSAKFVLLVGILFSAATLLLFYMELPSGVQHARTIAFTTIVVTELFIALSMRSSQPLLKIGLFSNKKLLLAIASSFVLQLAVIYVPVFDAVFETTEPTLDDWLPIFAVSLAILFILEIRKYVLKKSN